MNLSKYKSERIREHHFERINMETKIKVIVFICTSTILYNNTIFNRYSCHKNVKNF